MLLGLLQCLIWDMLTVCTCMIIDMIYVHSAPQHLYHRTFHIQEILSLESAAPERSGYYTSAQLINEK